MNGLTKLDPGKVIEMREHYLPGGVFYEQMNENDRISAAYHIDSAVNGLDEMKGYASFRSTKHDYTDFISFVNDQKDWSEELKKRAKENKFLLEATYNKRIPKHTPANEEALGKS